MEDRERERGNCYTTHSGRFVMYNSLQNELMADWFRPIEEKEKIKVVLRNEKRKEENHICYQKRPQINFTIIYQELGHKRPNKKHNERMNTIRRRPILGEINFTRIYKELGHPSRKQKQWGA